MHKHKHPFQYCISVFSGDVVPSILQAETAIISIPELDFEVQSGTLGGRFTTIEGLLSQMKENIRQSNPFGVGDSAIQSKLATFLENISEVGQSHIHYNTSVQLSD